MTNPYGPSGPSNQENLGRGSGQSRPVDASMQGEDRFLAASVGASRGHRVRHLDDDQQHR